MTNSLRIHCICADWCDTCGDFRALFDNAGARHAAQHPADVFAWHVLEDLEESFPELEVETFPTLLVTDVLGAPLFAGPILPNAAALQQLLSAAEAGLPVSRPGELARWSEIGRALAAEGN